MEDIRNGKRQIGQQSEDKDSEAETTPVQQISSASRPPPSHPILKKPRGPSSTGPRPTARFASPLGSPDDNGDIPSSGSTVVPALETKVSNMKSPPKKKNVASKKFVASSSGSKRRPVLVRKTSSQSSYGSDGSSSKDGGSLVGSRSPHSSVRPVSPIIEGVVKPLAEATADEEEQDSQEPVTPSAKALGKRPMVVRKATFEKKVQPKQSGKGLPPSEPKRKAFIEPERKTRTKISDTELEVDVAKESSPDSISTTHKDAVAPVDQKPLATPLPKSQPAPSGKGLPSSAPAKERQNLIRPMSMVNITSLSRAGTATSALSSSIPEQRAQETPSTRGPTSITRPILKSRSPSAYGRTNPALFTGTTASTSNVAVQGVIVDQSGVGSLPPSPFFDQHFGGSENSSSSSILDPKLTPTQPSTTESVPLGRTRSQLTLLLEREKSRDNGKSRK